MADNIFVPLIDADFSEETSPPSESTNPVASSPNKAGSALDSLLSDPQASQALAVGARRGNKIAEEGFAADLLNLSYGEIAAKYGKDVADNRYKIQGPISDELRKRNASRSTGDILKDAALGVGSGLVGLSGNLASLGLAGASKIGEQFGADGSTLDELAVSTAQATEEITEGITGLQSEALAGRKELSAVEAALDEQDREKQFEGQDGLIGTLSKVGKAALDTGDRITSDPAVAGDIIAQALGSLGPSAKLAKVGSSAAVRAVSKVSANPGVQKAARAVGSVAGVGVAEGSGSYSGAVNTVMDMSYEQLTETSPNYREYLESGLTPQQAKERLAVDTGREAFARQLPTAAVLGLLSSKFEAAPISSFKGSGIVGGLRTIGAQALEEAGQGGTGQYNENVAVLNNADPSTDVLSGVGESIAEGVVAGAGMAGVLATPNVAIDASKSAGDILAKAVASPQGQAVGEAVSSGVVKGANAAKDAAKFVAKPIAKKVADVNQSSNSGIQTEVVDSARNLETNSAQFVSQESVESSVAKLVNEPDSSKTPDRFKDYIPEQSNLVQGIKGVVEAVATKELSVNNLTDSEVLYVAEKFSQLRSVSKEAPKELKSDVLRIISSPDFQKAFERVQKIDLNETQSDTTEVNVNNVTDTVRVAKTNPTNVNPSFVDKILKHEDRKDLSEEDIKLLTAAKDIALEVNNHSEELVEISNRNRVALSKKPAYQANPSKLPEPLTVDKVSRSIQVSGYTDRTGRQLRSVNDFAADIIQAAQNPDNGYTYINKDGLSVPLQTVANQFQNFNRHMANKVEALNKSFIGNKNGKGPSVFFDTLIDGTKFVEAGKSGSNKVSYHSSSPKSVEFAEKVHNDAVVSANVYNILRKTFPELITGPEIVVPDLIRVEDEVSQTETNVETEAVAEVNEPAEQEETQDTSQDTTVLEEDTSPEAEVSDGQNQEDQVEVEVEEPTETLEDVSNELLQEETENDYVNLSDRFNAAFSLSGSEKSYSSAEDILDQMENNKESADYIKFARALIGPMIKGANDRLKSVQLSRKDNRSPIQAMKEGMDVSAIRDFKNLLFVDPTTDEYNPKLIGLASLAVVDWMASARSSDPGRLKDTVESLGITMHDLSESELESIMYGVPPRQAAESIAKQVMRLWDLEFNVDAPMVDTLGSVQTLVKELITVVDTKTQLINIEDIPTVSEGKRVTAQTINVKSLEDIQKRIGVKGQSSLRSYLNQDLDGPSIGKKIESTAQTQSRGDVQLSAVEKKALKAMQDTPHYLSSGISNFVEQLGVDNLGKMLGFTDLETFKGNTPLLLSVSGKNLAIQRDYEDALSVVKAVEESSDNPEAVPVHYPVSISKVGRHQFKGINPQNNKILRALVTPTHSTLDMTSKEDQDAFWLAISQSADMRKVENEDHSKILSEIQDQFYEKYSDAVSIALNWLETGDLLGEEFAAAMGSADMAQINSVMAVAQLEFAKKQGKESEFKTSLSFELDGKTDGPANMMVNFGQGMLTKEDKSNMNRVGYFLGRAKTSLNDYFSKKNVDLYEVTSRTAERIMSHRISRASGSDKEILEASRRFASVFGDFKIEEDGSISMTRTTSKNPMTKTVYGSGVRGVGDGIADDMMLEFYSKLVNAPDGVDMGQFYGYPNMENDIQTLFGMKLPEVLDTSEFQFPKAARDTFKSNISKGVGDVLSKSAKNVIGDPITNVNDTLVFITNLQTEYLSKIFEDRLQKLIDQKKASGEIKSARDISIRDYNNLVKELKVYAPLYSNGVQDLAVGSFSPKPSNIELSSNMDGKLRQASSLDRPDISGVEIIPYISIGRGDAMMMNTIYSQDNTPGDTLPVFDGIDMPVNKVKQYAPQINKAVQQNWDSDILGDIVADFESFMRRVSSDADKALLAELFEKIQKRSKTSTVSVQSPVELLNSIRTAQKNNIARKQAFKQIPTSVDHMGGSNSGYSRGEDADPVGLTEINILIQNELSKLDLVETIPANESYEDIGEYTAEAMAKALLREGKNKPAMKAVRAIMNKLPPEMRIVTGSIDNLNQYRKDNFPTDGLVLSSAGGLDVQNNVIFLAQKSEETLAHELIHASTFNQVLSHYEGESNSAVQRLEGLMNEFMELDFSTSSDVVQKAVNASRSAILNHQNNDDAFSKAAALNEFMAWALTNEQLAKTLSKTRTSSVNNFTKKVLQLMKKLMGGVSNDFFSNILFNTKLLNVAPSETSIISDSENGGPQDPDGSNRDDGNGNGNDGDGGEITPPARRFTNFWIDLVRDRIEESKKPGNLSKKTQLIRYNDTSLDILKSLDFGGFTLSDYQKQTFRAIHMVMATEMRLNVQSAEVLNKAFTHVTNGLTPEMFAGKNNETRYATVMSLMGDTKNDEGVSDAIAVLLALSQTSKSFRNALEQIPAPENHPIHAGSLNDFLSSVTGLLMRTAIGAIDTQNQTVREALDNLSEGIIRLDNDKEYSLLRGLMSNLDKADNFFSGAINELAIRAGNKAVEIEDSNRSNITKILAGSLSAALDFASTDRSAIRAQSFKQATHMGVPLDNLVFVREFVNEVIGTDETNADTVALLDKTNYAVSSVRQAYREELPVILQNVFENHPDEDGWKSLFNVLGKTDFAQVFDIRKPKNSMRLIQNKSFRATKINDLEAAINANFSPEAAKNILLKAKQLGGFMVGKGAGHQLWRNAYAINKMAGDYKESMTNDIDTLVSLYALDGVPNEQLQSVSEMYKNDPEAVTNLIVYENGLNKEEDQKIISPVARMNAYKGYIPNHPKSGNRIIISNDNKEENLIKMGFTRIKDFPGLEGSSESYGYYFTSVKQGGTYSQGVLQNVHNSVRGVDATTGLTVDGKVSGVLSGDGVESFTQLMNNNQKVEDVKESMLPVYNEDGEITAYEFGINPDVFQDLMEPKENMALMLGSWAGRQVEEKFAQQYNNELIDQLKKIYDDRETGTDDLFINISDPDISDKVYADTWRVIPAQTKDYIRSVFGDDSFYVRKDMINLALGYREASIIDAWTGKTRLPAAVTETIKAVSTMIMGDNAVNFISRTEEVVQSTVSSAKDLIVVRSLVVPYMNIQANVMQLATRGVGTKDMIRGYREKISEIETYNDNVTKLIELEARIRLAANDQNKVLILEEQIQAIKDQNARMTIAPLIAAGAYKNISEGITDLDVQLTSGRWGVWMENQINKLPPGVRTVAKYGLVSKDTALYKGANKAVQYGDFLSKSIIYDHLVEREGLSPEKAMRRVNEEFVNFSVLPGRTRTYLEGIGATWFPAFKIRIMKIAMSMLRENPVRSLITAGTVGDYGSPVNDNLATVAMQDRLEYSLGWDMLFGSPELNPWVNVTDWAK